MYLWIRHLTHSEAAALLAGTIYTFSPNHIAHFFAGHLNLSGIEWFPLFFWGLYELLKIGRRLDWRYILLTGLALGAIAFTSMYYLYMNAAHLADTGTLDAAQSAQFIEDALCQLHRVFTGQPHAQ